MQIHIHGDDYGRSKGITDSMSLCIDFGPLNSVSIPSIGHAFEYAAGVITQKGNVRSALHIDLVEGIPSSPTQDIPHLVNSAGRFHRSFVGLWISYLFSSKQTRKQMCTEIEREIAAQLQLYTKVMGAKSLSVDSHQHFHMIPFVFHILLNLAPTYNIKYIRLCNEPFFLSVRSVHDLKSYFGINIVKHLLLKYLSKQYMKRLDSHNISYNRYFIGVLFTGHVTVDSIRKALARITPRKSDIVEILFHVCKASPGEESYWKHMPELLRYYYSVDRDLEKATLFNPRLKTLVKNFSAREMSK